jgi:hypothetical protein
MATYMDAVNGKHTNGHEQGVNSHKVRYVHIVQVHPVELNLPNLHKVKAEREFATKEEAESEVRKWNALHELLTRGSVTEKAVYLGRVNHETGELE